MSEETQRNSENPRPRCPGLESGTGGLGIALSTRTAATRILSEGTERIPGHAASRLLRLLELLRMGRMETLGVAHKARLFDTFLDLWLHRNQETIARVCGLFFEETPRADPTAALPKGMIEAMIQAGRAERAERVKEKIWNVLMKTVPELHKRISPSDLLFGLWLDHPVSRGNIIRYLFTHFSAEAVLEAMKGRPGDTGKTHLPFSFLPVSNAMRLLKERPCILAEILHCNRLDPDERTRFQSVLYGTLNRFDLLRVLPYLPDESMETGETSAQCRQPRLPFRGSLGTASHDSGFGARVRAIKR